MASTNQGIRCIGGVLVDLSQIKTLNNHYANVYHNLAVDQHLNVHHNLDVDQLYNQSDSSTSSLYVNNLMTSDANFPAEQMAHMFGELSPEQQDSVLELTEQNLNNFGMNNGSEAHSFPLVGHQQILHMTSEPILHITNEPILHMTNEPEIFLPSSEEDIFSSNELSPTDSGVFVSTPSPDLSPQSHPFCWVLPANLKFCQCYFLHFQQMSSFANVNRHSRQTLITK